MAQIGFESVFDGASLALHAAFPDRKLHSGQVAQGMEHGALHVALSSAGEARQVGRRLRRNAGLEVTYYPEADPGEGECCRAAEQLLQALEEIVTPEGDILHATQLEWTMEDGLLKVRASYPHFVLLPEEGETMETLTVRQEE